MKPIRAVSSCCDHQVVLVWAYGTEADVYAFFAIEFPERLSERHTEEQHEQRGCKDTALFNAICY